MRGLGRQKLVLFLNVLAFWILAIPVGSLLTFVGNAGIAGMWWGYVIGIYSAGIVGVTALKYRISWEKEALKAAKRVSTLSSLFQMDPLMNSKPVEPVIMDNETADGSPATTMGVVEQQRPEDDTINHQETDP